jgi:hypothetical protein
MNMPVGKSSAAPQAAKRRASGPRMGKYFLVSGEVEFRSRTNIRRKEEGRKEE